jgi:diguanylate cyclase (GGDEF)-like protein
VILIVIHIPLIIFTLPSKFTYINFMITKLSYWKSQDGLKSTKNMHSLEEELFTLRQLNQQLQKEINSHKLLEAKLSSFQTQMRSFLEAMSDVMLIVNISDSQLKNIEILPTRLQSIYDGSANFIDETVNNFLGNNRNQEWLEKVRQALDENRTLYFDYMLSFDDSNVWFTAYIYPISENSVIWVGRDINERKQAELQEKSQLERLANIDELTQIANRRNFNNYLSQQWHQMKKLQVPIALILLDVDYFKRYNDTYGHQTGDTCLTKIAHAIKQVGQRQNDLVARYGGEEFAVILPNTNSKGALQIVQKIYKQIKKLQIPHSSSDLADIVTVSLGIAITTPQINTSHEELINKADRALYQAKEKGRNCYSIINY